MSPTVNLLELKLCVYQRLPPGVDPWRPRGIGPLTQANLSKCPLCMRHSYYRTYNLPPAG